MENISPTKMAYCQQNEKSKNTHLPVPLHKILTKHGLSKAYQPLLCKPSVLKLDINKPQFNRLFYKAGGIFHIHFLKQMHPVVFYSSRT